MIRRLACVAAAAGLLAGCASVPRSSAPKVVEKLDQAGTPAEQSVLQDTRPGVGSTESQIVEGFITAQLAWQDGHQPARRFLTRRADARWHDDARMYVATGTPKVGAPEPGHVVPMTFTPAGIVNRDGSYLPAFGAAAGQVTWRLAMKKENGEWRIDTPADAVVLSRTQFELFYQAYTLYFLDPSGGRLVPDRRYLPNDPGNLVDQLVRRLTDGPSDWLAPVASNDLAPPVSLNQVSTDRQVVHVDLSGLNTQVIDDRLGAVAQLVWTVSQLASVFGVQVTSDGQPVELRDVTSTVLGTTDLSRYDPDALPDTPVVGQRRPQPTRSGEPGDVQAGIQPYYVYGGAVYTLDGAQVLNGRYRLSSVGVSTDLQQLAGVGPAASGHGVTLWLGRMKGPLRPSSLSATGLSRPTWDRATGTFWTVADGRNIRSVALDGLVRPIRLDDGWLPRRLGTIGPLRLARDGTRVAFAAGPAGGQRLYVGRVHSTGDTITIENPVPVTPALADVRDVAWESASMLVVLGAPAGRRMAPWRVWADGSSTNPSPMPVPDVPGTVTITAAPDRPPVISSADGTLSINQGTWVAPRSGGKVRGSVPTYPG